MRHKAGPAPAGPVCLTATGYLFGPLSVTERSSIADAHDGVGEEFCQLACGIRWRRAVGEARPRRTPAGAWAGWACGRLPGFVH